MLASNIQIANRYSEALFSLSLEENLLPKVAADIKLLNEVLLTSPEVSSAICDISNSKPQILQLLDALANKANFNKISKNFLHLVVKANRVKVLPDIAKLFVRKFEEHNGSLFVDVTAAEKLDKEQIALIEKKLSDVFKKNVIGVIRIDKKILGGLIVSQGSKMWDSSLGNKISRLNNLSKQAIINF